MIVKQIFYMLKRFISFNDILNNQYAIMGYFDECQISKKIMSDTVVRHDD